MKKWLSLILAMLLLTGCAGKGEQTAQTEQTEPQPVGLYDPEHRIEQQTGGAVRTYPMQNTDYDRLYMIGSKVLLVSPSGKMIVVKGEEGHVMAEGQLEESGKIVTTGVKGAAVYVSKSREVVLLNPQLQQTNRIQLPEDIQGEPAVSLGSNEIYFCRDGEIRAMNMENGVARLIKSHVVAEQTILGCYYEGKMVCCAVKDQDGVERQIYLSAENGTTISEDSGIYHFDTFKDRHLVLRKDNRIHQVIVGSMSGKNTLLDIPQESADTVAENLAGNGVLTYAVQEENYLISFHDIRAGQTTAQVKIAGIGDPIVMSGDEQLVWILANETVTDDSGNTTTGQVLLRWDRSQSVLAEPLQVASVLYTSQEPDEEGLKLSKETAESFRGSYGVRVNIWEDAVKTTGPYNAVAEHQPLIINEMLAELEPALQAYPEGFLQKTVKSGWVRICFVRSIRTGEDWVQFWENGDFYLLISAKADVAKAFREAVGYAIDSRVLGNSRRYDNWTELNPDGFLYTAESDGQTQDVTGYMDGEARAFVNMQSITSATEDRRQIFMAAMDTGNEAVFASKTMQAKLRRICEGIREAYGLQNKKVLFQWEQYLEEPLVQVGDNNG